MNQTATAEIRDERHAELSLLSSTLDGDTEARKSFFLRYAQVVEGRVRLILRRAGRWISEDDVQDTVSEIWLSLFEDDMRPLRRFDPDRQIKLSTWVGLLARNKTIDKLRTSHMGRTVSIDDGTSMHEPHCCRPLPADEVELDEERALAQQALGQLTHEEQRFIKAWYVDDREPEDLAQEFGIAIGTVYSRRFKIQAKLARAVHRLNQPRRARRPITPHTLH